HGQLPGSAASGRMDAASQLTRTRDPTSATPRRAGSYVTACSEVPATSTVYSTFSPRNVRLRTIPTAVASPSGGFAFSGAGAMEHHGDPVRGGHGFFLVVGDIDGGDGELLLEPRELGAHLDA